MGIVKNKGAKPVSTNPIGKFKDEAMDAAKGVVGGTAKGLAAEPKKILESILGKPTTNKDQNGDVGIESLAGGGGQAADPQAQKVLQQQMAQKNLKSQQEAQRKLAFYRKWLQEQEQFHEAQKQKEASVDNMEEQKEEQEKQEEVVQLQKERVKSEQLNRQTKGRLGSREQKGSKF